MREGGGGGGVIGGNGEEEQGRESTYTLVVDVDLVVLGLGATLVAELPVFLGVLGSLLLERVRGLFAARDLPFCSGNGRGNA